MKKITLLHVTSSLKIGGAEAVLCNLIKKLGNTEFDHHVIYFHSGPNIKNIKRLGAKTYQVKGMVCLYDPLFFVRLFAIIKKTNPKMVHSLLWSANITSRIVSWFLRIPHVSVYHSDICIDGIFRNTLDRITRKMSNLVVAVSDHVAISLGGKKTYKELAVIKNGIDFEELHEKSKTANITRQSLGIAEDAIVIGSVGRFHPQKNYSLLLRSFALVYNNLPEAKLLLVGVGPQETMLRNLAYDLELGSSVVFIVGKSACGYFPIFDMFVQSSNNEGLSIALLEAMSFGLPAIVTSKDALHPVISHKNNGIITAVGDEHMLAYAIVGLIRNRLFAKNIGNAGKKNVEDDFSDLSMVAAYKKLFNSFSNRKL